MMATRYKEAPATASGLLGLALALLCGACAADLPPAWRIAPDPVDPDTGELDPRGKLRVLAIAAEPPEAAPGETVSLSALVVTHPRHGLQGESGPSPRPRGLDLLWLACRAQEGLPALPACGLGEPGTSEEVDLGAGPAASLPIAAGAAPGTLLVTLVAADEGQPGGARGCLDVAKRARGLVERPNRCVIGIKRVKVSLQGPRNLSPGLAAFTLGEATLPQEEDGPAGRPLTVRRAPDAVEKEPDPDTEGAQRDEILQVALFATAGKLAAGRGGFADPACDAGEGCAQIEESTVRWDPPGADAAALEAPDGRVYLFAVLRDDRGGLSYATLLFKLP